MYWYKTEDREDSYVDLSKAKRIGIERKGDFFKIIAEFSLSVDSNEDVIIGTYGTFSDAQYALSRLMDSLNGDSDDSE